MIRQLYRNPQLSSWTKRSIASWPQELRERYFVPCGSHVVGRTTPGHHDELFEEQELCLGEGDTQVRDTSVYTKSDGLLDSPAYLEALQQLATSNGAIYRFSQEVQSLVRGSDDWEIETTAGETFEAPVVVNAAGAWVNKFITDSSLRCETQPFARHLFVVDSWPDGYMPANDCGFFWDESRGWYLRKWNTDYETDTSRLVSICDRVPADPETFTPRPETQIAVETALRKALPETSKQLRFSNHWHCYRTYTDDQAPIWGEDPLARGLFWLAAFGGFGMSTSFAATEDAARYLCGEKVFVPADFLPTRARTMALQKSGAF